MLLSDESSGLIHYIIWNQYLQGEEVILLDISQKEVGKGIFISDDKDKMLMGKSLGDVFCEVSVSYAIEPDAPLLVKDKSRSLMKHAMGTHIIWWKDYVCICVHYWFNNDLYYLWNDVYLYDSFVFADSGDIMEGVKEEMKILQSLLYISLFSLWCSKIVGTCFMICFEF